jgi:hypothetical protein
MRTFRRARPAKSGVTLALTLHFFADPGTKPFLRAKQLLRQIGQRSDIAILKCEFLQHVQEKEKNVEP